MIKEKLKRGSIFYKLYLYFDIFIRYSLFRKNRKSFSQYGEDLFINDFFKNQAIGKYVDLGAFHPMRLSNTYLLYKKGWSGTNVDLNPISIDFFNLARKNDNNICALISDQDNQLKDAYFVNPWSAANSINKSENTKIKKEMITETFSNIVNHDFDFLNIDLEGHDYSVLRTINFNKFHPKLVCIEILSDDLNKKNIFNHMTQNNFVFHKNLGPSFFFTKGIK
tara:strand:- start:7635 stop:8303 length:669 start_codon:yes stop_codon:yes gene_type:complete